MASKGHRAVNAKRSRRAGREAQAAAVEPELYEAPPAIECYELVLPVEMDYSNARITQHLRYHEGRLVKFSIVLSLCFEEGGQWEEDYSIDTGHGHLHEHPVGHQIGEIRHNLYPLFTQVDVQESYEKAYSMVYDRYLMRANRG